MSSIHRDLSRARQGLYDLIVVGGGIYGIMLAHEASRAGLRVILLEKDDFGQHTSFNSLRIVHGGLRYLQSLDIKRFRESVAERTWFLKHFPGLVRPIPCLMPLYGNGFKRPSVLRAALLLNHALSCKRNRGLPDTRRIPYGRIIDVEETRCLFPAVNLYGLKGAVIWYDAFMEDSQCLVIEILRQACARGAVALNYVRVVDLLVQNGEVRGVKALDIESGQSFEVQGRRVVNAAGPWCRELARRFDRDIPALFTPSLAWNVLFKMDPLSDYAVAAMPRKPGGQTYFIVPWKGAVLAGTGHEGCCEYDGGTPPRVSREQINKFICGLNEALPGHRFSIENVVHIFSGYLPAVELGVAELTHREVIVDHAMGGGPEGLFSISGIKFTTSRKVAEKAIKLMFPNAAMQPENLPACQSSAQQLKHDKINWLQLSENSSGNSDGWMSAVQKVLDEESVRHLDDLVIRRLPLSNNPNHCIEVASKICGYLKWDELLCSKEIARLKNHFQLPEGLGLNRQDRTKLTIDNIRRSRIE